MWIGVDATCWHNTRGYGLLREFYPRRTALLAVVLLSLSLWFVFMSMNFMAHTFTLTCALAAVLAVVRASKTGKFTWGLIGGSGVGMVSLIRPLDGVVMAGLLGLWAFIASHRRLKVLACFGLGTLTIAAAVLPYNRHITGQFDCISAYGLLRKILWTQGKCVWLWPWAWVELAYRRIPRPWPNRGFDKCQSQHIFNKH
jgi:4-amino-4-deoxy-L-arabinose transferase-like glycosyltransferase